VRTIYSFCAVYSRSYVEGLTYFSEPCYLIYDVKTPVLDEALLALKKCLSFNKSEDSITLRAREKRIERVGVMNDEHSRTVGNIILFS
jgi:proteasome activator subunit 4